MARMSTVSSAIAAIAAMGLVAAGGAGAGPGSSADAADTSPAPSMASIVGDGWAFFTGTVRFDGQFDPGPTEPYEDNGLWVGSGGFHGQTMVSDDPRMTGTRSEVNSAFSDAPDGSTKDLIRSLVTIENDEGTWTCDVTGISIVWGTKWYEAHLQSSGWCTGAGAYEGMTAYVAFDPADDRSFGLDAYGFITTGDGPPIPAS